MQTKSSNSADMKPHDRLAKVGEILARGIYRMKQREQKERENGLYEPIATAKPQNSRQTYSQFQRQEIKK